MRVSMTWTKFIMTNWI